MTITRARELEKVAKFLIKLQKRRSPKPVDVEIEWPPENGVYLVAWTDLLVHGNPATRVGQHYLRSEAWGGGDDIDEARISGLLRHAAQHGARQPVEGGPELYVRLHDSNHSRSLRTGRSIIDRKRPDWVPAPRRPVRVSKGSAPADPREGQELRRGERLSASRTLVGARKATAAAELAKRFLATGIRVALEDDGDTISHLTYIPPYPRKVCGIWLGASASEVQSILGTAEQETSFGKGNRGWIYDHDGHLCVCFDKRDRVGAILR